MTRPTVSQIREVQHYLPINAATDFQWAEDKIVTVLVTTDFSLAQTVRLFWLERVTETFGYIDVNETGSSRTLSQVHANAKAMLDYWDKRVEAEGLVSSRKPISFGVIDAT